MLIEKALSLLIYPLGLSLVAGGLGLALLALWSRQAGSVMVALGLLWLTFWSLPPIADELTNTLERRSAHLEIQDVPEADVILVFGGVMLPPDSGHPYADLGAAADRVWHSARLYHAGKAPSVILSGGRKDWQAGLPSQASVMAQLLAEFGVPRSAMVLEDRSRNTYENALYCVKLMRGQDSQRALLVTSALHMPRALAVLQATGVDAVPVATDFKVRNLPGTLLDWIPSSRALHNSTLALHEWVGIAVYSWRGWM